MPLVGGIIFLVLFFAGMVFILYKVMGSQARQTSDYLERLRSQHGQELAEVRKEKEQAEEEINSRLERANEEAGEIKRQAVKAADEEKQKIVDKGREEAENIVAEANKLREELKIELINKMDVTATEKAIELIGKYLPEELAKGIHDRWVKEVLDNGLPRVSAADLDQKNPVIEVQTARELSPNDLEDIHNILKAKCNFSGEVKQTVHPEMIAGIKIKSGFFEIELCLETKLKQDLQDAKDRAE